MSTTSHITDGEWAALVVADIDGHDQSEILATDFDRWRDELRRVQSRIHGDLSGLKSARAADRKQVYTRAHSEEWFRSRQASRDGRRVDLVAQIERLKARATIARTGAENSETSETYARIQARAVRLCQAIAAHRAASEAAEVEPEPYDLELWAAVSTPVPTPTPDPR